LHYQKLTIKKFIIMSTLLNAMQTKDSFTENGMSTNSSSLNLCVDLFFQIGAMRGQDKQRLINVFTKAFGENSLTAMRLLFWARDVRGGAGERKIFRDIIEYLAANRTDALRKNLHLIAEFGRWDDLLVLVGTPLEKEALELIAEALNAKTKAEQVLKNLDSLSEDECAKLITEFSV
jgi:hypothetical protein